MPESKFRDFFMKVKNHDRRLLNLKVPALDQQPFHNNKYT